uniref:Reverse transcriptase domain-containing protein n=1 Tax=Macrostomum lignano TaxID=282301 RepID=A0A1I8HE60_9PLAT
PPGQDTEATAQQGTPDQAESPAEDRRLTLLARIKEEKPNCAKCKKTIRVSTVLQWNADGIRNKMGELEELVQRLKVDVVMIQESKLDSVSRTPKIPGFTTVRKDRRTLRSSETYKGGGLLTLIRQEIPFRRLKGWSGGTVEGCRIVINLSAKQRLVLTNIYRPPIRRNAGADCREHPDIDLWLKPHQREIIAGDFNLHHTTWGSLPGQGPEGAEQAKALLEWCDSNGYCVLNSGSLNLSRSPRRWRECPDISLASAGLDDLCSWEALDELGSDHKPILITVDGDRASTDQKICLAWAWQKADWNSYQAQLEDDSNGLNKGTVKQQIQRLCFRMSKAAKACIPMKRVSSKNKPYWDSELSSLRDERNRLRSRGGDPDEWKRKNAELNRACAEKKAAFWQEFQPTAKNEILVADGKECSSDRDKANAFGRHYAKISTLKHDAADRAFKVSTAKRLNKYPTGTSEHDCALTMGELKRVISHLDVTKKAGPDGIEAAFFRHLPDSGVAAKKQVARLVQEIQDHWEQRPPRKTIAVTLDCSRAFDRVWRTRLLARLMDEGVPGRMVHWFASFLEGRQIAVRVGDTIGKWRPLKEGVPQGAVCSPVLFLLYINDWADSLVPDVNYAGFADDLGVWASGSNIQQIAERLQLAIDRIDAWATDLRIDLNPLKTECCIFSRDRRDRDRTLNLCIRGQQLPTRQELRYLGVWIDSGLLFKRQSDEVAAKLRRRCAVLRALSHREWGWDRATLRTVYKAVVESVVWHAAAAWMPWLSQTRLNDLDRAQKVALRLVSGLPSSTPSVAIYREADCVPISLEAKRRALVAVEKALRRPEADPWRSSRLPGAWVRAPPWDTLSGSDRLRLYPQLVRPLRKSDSQHTRDPIIADTFRERLPSTCYFTDGSASGGTANGGAAWILFDQETGTIIRGGHSAAGRWCSSFETELRALRDAVVDVIQQDIGTAALLTDSQAAVRAGHCPSSAYYAKRIGKAQLAECRLCGLEVDQFHLVHCPAIDVARRQNSICDLKDLADGNLVARLLERLHSALNNNNSNNNNNNNNNDNYNKNNNNNNNNNKQNNNNNKKKTTTTTTTTIIIIIATTTTTTTQITTIITKTTTTTTTTTKTQVSKSMHSTHIRSEQLTSISEIKFSSKSTRTYHRSDSPTYAEVSSARPLRLLALGRLCQLILQQILSERNSLRSVDAAVAAAASLLSDAWQDVLRLHQFDSRIKHVSSYGLRQTGAAAEATGRAKPSPWATWSTGSAGEHRGCGTDPAVARVVRFSVSPTSSAPRRPAAACRSAAATPADAFVALLAVGNMGRAAAAPPPLLRGQSAPGAGAPRLRAAIGCADLTTTRTTTPGGRATGWRGCCWTGALDAELRIAAYRALAAIGLTGQRADSLRSAVRRLLTSPNEDRQTQLFVRTHLSGLAGGASDLLTGQGRESAPDIAKELDWTELSWRDLWVVFRVAIPRYIGLNLTLIDPGRGRQGQRAGARPAHRGRRRRGARGLQALRPAVRSLKIPGMDIFLRRRGAPADGRGGPDPGAGERMQAAQEPRVDIVVRQSGAEVSHSTVSGIGLTAPLQLLKNIDFSTIRQLMEALPQFKKFFDSKRSSMSAGVLSEEAVSLPTISGAPLIVKSSAHYLTELRLDKLDRKLLGQLELRPVAALRQSRTVSVDAPFERMGVRTNLSFLTNTGLGLSLERARSDEADSDQTISMKLEPLDKRQSLADAKTDAAFFWHAIGADGEATPVEQPLVPSEGMEQSVRCTDNFIKKHSGLKLCVQSKKVSWRCALRPDTGSSSWRFELINPVFPVSLFAQVTNSTSESQLQADVRIGSVEYKAEGAAQWASADSPQMRLAGSFYRKDKAAGEISLAHRMDGRVLVLLPRASTAFNLTLQSGNQLRLLYDLQTAAANFTWKIASEYASPAGVLHSGAVPAEGLRRRHLRLKVRNAEGRRVGHSLHAKLQRSIGAISRANVSVLHQLRLGSALRRSPLDFKLQVGLSETINGATWPLQLLDGSIALEVTHYWHLKNYVFMPTAAGQIASCADAAAEAHCGWPPPYNFRYSFLALFARLSWLPCSSNETSRLTGPAARTGGPSWQNCSSTLAPRPTAPSMEESADWRTFDGSEVFNYGLDWAPSKWRRSSSADSRFRDADFEARDEEQRLARAETRILNSDVWRTPGAAHRVEGRRGGRVFRVTSDLLEHRNANATFNLKLLLTPVSYTGSTIVFQTKHSNFQEIKLKIGREQLTGLAGETNFTAIAKFHAFGWKVGARQSGIVTANTNPAKYKRLVSVRGDLELVGLENYIQRKRFNGEALLQLKHSNEFDLLFSVATPSPAGIELPLLRLSSNFEFAPLRAELKLRTAGSSGRLLSYGARVEFEPSRKANADVEFGERRAELGWSLQPSLGGAGHSAQFLARNSFLVAQPVFVHGVLNSTWPLRAEPLEASMEVRLSSTRFPGMSMSNYLERKLALLSIIAQPDNSVTDVFRLSYNQSADFEGIRGDTFAKFDLSSFSENIATRSVRVKYLFGVEKELHFEASQDSTAIHTGRILWYSEPRQVASVRGVAEAADFVVAIKSQRSWAVYLARSPIAASRSSVWHLSYDQFNDANQLSTPFSAKVEISDPWSVRNGEVSIYEKTFELRTHPAGGIELVVKTGAPVLYRVLWSSSGDSGTAGDKSMRLEIRVDDSITVAEIVRRPGQAVVTYGRQDAPNTLTVAYTVSGNRMNLTVSHRVDSRSSSAQILPGVTVPLPATPFRLAAQNRGGLKGDFQLSLASSAAGSLTYGHSLSRLPRALSARANLTGPRGDSLWQLSADLDRGERIAEIRTSLNGVFHFVLAEQLLQFRSSDVADLSLAFPSFRTSRTNQGGVGAKAVSLSLTVPLLGLRRSVELAAEHQLVENGRKVVLSYGRAGAEMLNGYLTVTEQTDHGVNFSVEAQLTSNAGLLWSATTVKTQMSAGMLRGEDNYTMAFSSRVFVDGIENSAVTAGLLGGSGGWPSRPSRGSARAAGTDWEVGFDLSRPDGSKSLGGRLVRWAGAQVGPYSANASLGSTGQPGGRDFRFETESPQRHFVVAKEFDPTLDRKSLKFFINRRLNRGLVVALQRGPEPQQRALEFELPTRLIRVEIWPLQNRSESSSLAAGRGEASVAHSLESSSGLGVRVAWDAARAPDRKIRLDLMAGSEGSVWAACDGGRYRPLRTGAPTAGRRPGDGASPVVSNRPAAGDQRPDGGRRRQLAAERDSRDGRRLSGRRISLSPSSLLLGDVRIEVPSHGVNKSFKFVYRPLREFTCAGDNGSAISLRFAPGQRLDRFTVFASGNDRQAARLDAVLDKRRSRLTAALDTGLGGFDFPANLRASRRFGGGSGGPGFRPNATLVFASAGVSDDGRRAHAAVLVGRMRFGQWPDPAEPASVPAGLNLFSLGLRLHGNNSMEGSSAWRSERVDGVKSAVAHLKESLLDTWMASGLRAFGSATDALLRAAGERLLKSVDAKRLAEEATNPLLADLTALKLYAEAVVEAVGSDPRLGAIVRLLKRFSGAASWRVAELSDWLASRLSEGGVGLVDLRLAERVQLAADAAVEFVDSLPLLAAWRAGLDAGKSAAGLVSDWLSGCLEVSDSFLRRMLSSGAAVSGRDGATASVLRLLSERASQLLSLGSVKAEMAKALLQIELALQAAVSDSLGLLADDLLPFAIGHLGDLVRLKEWLDDALYELRLWIDFGAGSGEAERRERLLSWPLRLARQLAGPGSLGYWRNLEDSWRLLTNGEFAAAVRRLLMTDAYGLRVWRPVCDAKCRESGDAAFAAVVGDVYPPVYLDSLSPRVWRRRLARVRSIRATARRFRGRLFATSSDGYELLSMFNDWRQMDAGLWDPLVRQLAMRHRTAVLVGGRSLITFDGISLVNPLPCSYVLAHDFRLNEFTVAQSYREVNGTAVRHDLLVRFGSVQYSISPSGVLKINGRIEKLPMSRYVGGRLVQAERKKSRLLVRFHGETLRNTLLLRCNSITDSCVLRVHPLYQARVDGMAGSNDGHRANDLQGGSRDSHIRYWTSGRCLATETGGPDATLSPAVESPEAEANCRLWFSWGNFSFDKCFTTVNPRPYLDLCRAFARLGKDICEVAVQYTDRCRNELVNINTPYSCVRCRVDEETTIVKDDLISEPRVLRKRLQAVFLLENSDCVASAIGLRGSYISYLAKLIERLNMSYPDLKSVEFGLAHFGGQGEPVLTAHPIHDTSRRFGNLADLNAGLVKVRLNGTSVHQCTARSWDYARAFDKAFKVVSSEIFLHVLTKRGIPRPTRINDWLQNLIGYDRREVFYSDRRRAEPIGSLTALNPSGDCSAELAMDSYNKGKGKRGELGQLLLRNGEGEERSKKKKERKRASGTVWHLDRFAASRSHSVKISRRIFRMAADPTGAAALPTVQLRPLRQPRWASRGARRTTA